MAFEVHRLNQQGLDKAAKISKVFTDALIQLQQLTKGAYGHATSQPGDREMAIVRTKLEEACFFAKRAMALDPTNQEKP